MTTLKAFRKAWPIRQLRKVRPDTKKPSNVKQQLALSGPRISPGSVRFSRRCWMTLTGVNLMLWYLCQHVSWPFKSRKKPINCFLEPTSSALLCTPTLSKHKFDCTGIKLTFLGINDASEESAHTWRSMLTRRPTQSKHMKSVMVPTSLSLHWGSCACSLKTGFLTCVISTSSLSMRPIKFSCRKRTTDPEKWAGKKPFDSYLTLVPCHN